MFCLWCVVIFFPVKFFIKVARTPQKKNKFLELGPEKTRGLKYTNHIQIANYHQISESYNTVIDTTLLIDE